MNVKTFIAHGASLLAICATANVAVAQPTATAPAAPAAASQAPQTPPLPGAALTGVCFVSRERVFAGSSVGRAIGARLQQLGSQANAELQAERRALDTDIQAFRAAQGTLDQTAGEQRAAALQVRDNAWQRKAQLRQREIQFTQQYYASIRFRQEMDPVMLQVATARQCSILLDDNVVLAGNAAMDLTPTVITGLNARIQTMSFDRIQVNPQTGEPIPPGQGAAAARPATPAPR